MFVCTCCKLSKPFCTFAKESVEDKTKSISSVYGKERKKGKKENAAESQLYPHDCLWPSCTHTQTAATMQRSLALQCLNYLLNSATRKGYFQNPLLPPAVKAQQPVTPAPLIPHLTLPVMCLCLHTSISHVSQLLGHVKHPRDLQHQQTTTVNNHIRHSEVTP